MNTSSDAACQTKPETPRVPTPNSDNSSTSGYDSRQRVKAETYQPTSNIAKKIASSTPFNPNSPSRKKLLRRRNLENVNVSKVETDVEILGNILKKEKQELKKSIVSNVFMWFLIMVVFIVLSISVIYAIGGISIDSFSSLITVEYPNGPPPV